MSRLTEEEIEQIARVVQGVVARESPPKEDTSLKKWAVYLFENWHLPTFAFLLLVFIGAMAFEGASPLYYFKKVSLDDRDIQDKLAAYQYRDDLTSRYLELGYMLLDQGLATDALKEFEEAKKISSNRTDVEYAIRIARLFQEDAAGQYNPSVFVTRVSALFGTEITPPPSTGISESPSPKKRRISDPHVLMLLADFYRLSGDSRNATEVYKNALSLRPSLGNAALGLGHMAYDAGDFGNAIAHYDKAREAYPDNVQYISALASAHRRNGDLKTAFDLFNEARTADPDNLVNHVEMSIVLRSSGRFAESYALLDNLLRQLEDRDMISVLMKTGSANDDPWLIGHRDGSEILTTHSEKLAYIYSGAAFSGFLAGVQESDKLSGYIDKGRIEAKAINLIRFESSELAEKISGMGVELKKFEGLMAAEG